MKQYPSTRQTNMAMHAIIAIANVKDGDIALFVQYVL